VSPLSLGVLKPMSSPTCCLLLDRFEPCKKFNARNQMRPRKHVPTRAPPLHENLIRPPKYCLPPQFLILPTQTLINLTPVRPSPSRHVIKHLAPLLILRRPRKPLQLAISTPSFELQFFIDRKRRNFPFVVFPSLRMLKHKGRKATDLATMETNGIVGRRTFELKSKVILQLLAAIFEGA